MMVVRWTWSYNSFAIYWCSNESFTVCWSWGWMHRVSRFFYNSIETIVVVGSVVDGTESAVWFCYSVVSFDYITITFFVLGFVISCVAILNTVVEFVFWMSLKIVIFQCCEYSMILILIQYSKAVISADPVPRLKKRSKHSPVD